MIVDAQYNVKQKICDYCQRVTRPVKFGGITKELVFTVVTLSLLMSPLLYILCIPRVPRQLVTRPRYGTNAPFYGRFDTTGTQSK
jgi:hypothetical protein